MAYTVKVNKPGSLCFHDLKVQIFNNCGIFLPEVFSPNGDGTNDTFKIVASPCVAKLNKFIVFNRWGETVFSNANFIPGEPNAHWDGTFNGQKVQADSFGYRVVFTLLDGEIKNFQGAVLLAR